MNWVYLNLWLIVAVLLTPYLVAAEDDHGINLNDEEELVPSEQMIENNDMPAVQRKVSAHPAGKFLRQSVLPNFGRNIGRSPGFQLARGLIQAPFVGQPLDGQASSPSNKVVLVLNNDKNKFSDLAKPAEESLRRLTRNPDVVEDLVGQFQQLGGGVLQQVSQTAPDMSKSFGQALNDALSQTSLLAQSPGNLDLSQLTQTISQSNLPGNFDFGQLGQSLSQSFIVGAAQNLLNPQSQAQTAPNAGAAAAEEGAAAADAEAVPESIGAAAEAEPEPEPEPEAAPEPAPSAASETPKTPFEQIVGSALSPLGGLGLPTGQGLPLGMLGSLTSWNPLMPLGSEISESRVLPDQYSPYKILPKQVDHQTMAEMKLKAVLKDALAKKTIPILWFHLPANHQLQKTNEDLEMEAKLEIFEKQVVAELKQLQELSKLANEVKINQLQSGVQPTTSLTTKLNLHEIPIYEITLGDIEKTLKDEHVIMLMHTIVQNQKKDFHKHHQVTTKYLTDLTGTPIKRQIKTADDTFKSMEKDDMFKMMTYAYRMAAVNGHEMPWLKNEKITGLNEKTTTTSQARQPKDGSMHMTSERQWLEDKQQQMAMEAEKQRQMAEERKQKVPQNLGRQWADPNMRQLPEQQPIERQWSNPTMMQEQQPMQRQMMPAQMQQMPVQRQMMPTQMQQMPIERQMIPSQMQQPMPIQIQMLDPNMQVQQQNIQPQMMQQPMMSAFNMQPQLPMQRQWVTPTNMPQQQTMIPGQMTNPMMQRQWVDTNTPETKGTIKMEQQPEQRQAFETQTPEQSTSVKTAEQKQPAEPTGPFTKTIEQTSTKTSNPTNTSPAVSEAKPQMAENAGKTRHTGIADLFDEFDVFDHGKFRGKGAKEPTVINYYYSPGGSRYPPIYAPAPPAAPQSYGGYGGGYAIPSPPPAAQSYGPAGGYGGGYARPSPPSYPSAPQYNPASSHYGGSSYGGYRSATGDEEIAAMLQKNQPMPKMMMMPNDEEHRPHTITTTSTTKTTTADAMENDKNNAEYPNINHFKRLEKKHTESDKSPAAYIIVIRNNASKSGQSSSSSSSRSRRKRSTEYATLEPIDEKSLNALRKTYKNSLKEITLNPNETPAEALMRYNAESIREALEKANQQPMEISAGGEHEEVKEGKLSSEVEEQQQGHAIQQQQITQHLPQGYALSDNGQYIPMSAGPQSQFANGPYMSLPMPIQQTQPLAVAYNQQGSVNDPILNQDGFYNNFIAKYNTPAVYSSNNKIITQNPFLSVYNSLESVPYIDDYSVPQQPYQLANHNAINTAGKVSKPMVYQKSYGEPQLSYNHLTTPPTYSKSSNSISKNFNQIHTSGHSVTDYGKPQYDNYANDLPSTKTHYTLHNAIQKNGNFGTYIPARQPQLELGNRYKKVRSQESYSFENLMAVIKERLAQCCNECKENILKGLDETLKEKNYGRDDKLKILEINVKPYATITDKPHTLTYRKPSKEEDFEYNKWLTAMAEKGYDKNYLTKQHQREYLRDGKLNLHITDEEDYDHAQEKIFYRNNLSYKRETVLPETKVEPETEAEIVTVPIATENNIEKLETDGEEEEDVVEEEDETEIEPEEETEPQPEKVIPNEIKIEKSNNKLEKDKKNKNENKVTVKKENPENVNTTKSMETAESTTHSVYALRGKFRPHKHNPAPFALKQGKQFSNYKNINKWGKGNSIPKTDKKNTVNKDDKLEEILDILHDLSKHTKEKMKESSKEENSKTTTSFINSSTPTISTMPSPTSSTVKPLTTPSTSAENGISKSLKSESANSTEKPKKLSRRRTRLSTKSRKLVNTSTQTSNSYNQTSSSLKSPPFTPSTSIVATTTSSSLSPSSSSSSSSKNANASGPEVGSLFSFGPKILEPFMGLHRVDHPDDPWHHKAYDPYQPIYTGGGTFEEYIKTGRYKRDLAQSASSPLSLFSKNRNTLTPEMLGRLLSMKSSFKKNYPGLYKTMMGQLTSGKSTTITVTPPKVPQHVSYKNLELAAAEINPLETLKDTYDEDFKNIMAAQKRLQLESPKSLINSYQNEYNFWSNLQQVPKEETQVFPQSPKQLALSPQKEETNYWENPQETFKTQAEETFLSSPEEPFPYEAQNFWDNSQESLKTLAETELFLENSQEQRDEHHIIKENTKDSINKPQSYWENSEETLKTFNEQQELLHKPQDTAIEEQSFWETPEQNADDVHNMPHETLTSLNDEEHNFWKSSKEPSAPSAVQKRSSFWAELEAAEEEQQHEHQHHLDDTEPIFNFDEDFD